MAAGDFTVFDAFLNNLGKKIHDMDTDTFKMGLITDAVTPTAADALPHWGGTGTTDHSATETTDTSGLYTAEGETVVSPTWAVGSNILKWDFSNVAIAKNAANPGATGGQEARYGMVYNSSDANKRCIGFLDLGGNKDLTAGDFLWTIDATDGVFRIGVGTIT